MAFFTENDLEQLSMQWFTKIGYEVKTGNEISHSGLYAERDAGHSFRIRWKGEI